MGDGQNGDLRADFDRRLKLKFLVTIPTIRVPTVGGLCAKRPPDVSKLPPDALHALSGHKFLVKELQLKPRPFNMGKLVASRRSRADTCKTRMGNPGLGSRINV